MTTRWMPVGVLTLALFVINVIARLIVRFTIADPDDQFLVGLYAIIAMVLVSIVAGFWWTRRYPTVRVIGEVGLALLVGCLLAVLVGPLTAGDSPFASGAGLFFRQLGLAVVLTAAGGLVGMLVVMMFGWDTKSRAFQRAADYYKKRPARR